MYSYIFKENLKGNTIMIDLHIHTTSSDGEHSVKEIIKMAKQKGLKGIAITDHDTVAAIPEALILIKDFEVEIIPGIEISAEFNVDMHILGYYVDYNNKELLDYTKMMQENRYIRNEAIISQFNKLGISITLDEVRLQKGT